MAFPLPEHGLIYAVDEKSIRNLCLDRAQRRANRNIYAINNLRYKDEMPTAEYYEAFLCIRSDGVYRDFVRAIQLGPLNDRRACSVPRLDSLQEQCRSCAMLCRTSIHVCLLENDVQRVLEHRSRIVRVVGVEGVR